MGRRRRVDRVSTHQGVRIAFKATDAPDIVELKVEAPGAALMIVLPLDLTDLAELQLLVSTQIERLEVEAEEDGVHGS